MLVNKNESRNWSAVSAVNVSESSGDAVMYMNASYNGTDLNFSKNIQNMALYETNKETVDADYAQFEQDVIDDISNV